MKQCIRCKELWSDNTKECPQCHGVEFEVEEQMFLDECSG